MIIIKKMCIYVYLCINKNILQAKEGENLCWLWKPNTDWLQTVLIVTLTQLPVMEVEAQLRWDSYCAYCQVELATWSLK